MPVFLVIKMMFPRNVSDLSVVGTGVMTRGLSLTELVRVIFLV